MQTTFKLMQNVWRAEALPGSLLLFGNLFLFKPAVIYHGNAPFFFYSFAQSLVFLFPAFLVCVALGVLPSMGRPTKGKTAYAAFVTAIAIVAWVDGSFLSSTTGLLDGRTFELMADSAALWTNTILVVGVFCASFLFAVRYTAIVRSFLLALTAALAVLFSYTLVSDPNPWREPPAANELAQFSDKQNLLVILLDAFQSDFFAELIKQEVIRSGFDGFTYFSNATSTAPTTMFSVPAIHSGQIYEPGKDAVEYRTNAIVRDSFLSALAERDYKTFLVNPIAGHCPAGVVCHPDARLLQGGLRHELHTAATLMDFSLIRVLPHILKPLVFRDAKWLFSSMTSNEHVAASNSLLDFMARTVTVSSQSPTAKFLHLFNTHAPAAVDKECLPISGNPWTRETAIEQASCALEHVKKLLGALQTSGVYDNTAIIILADHGSHVPGGGLSAAASPLLLVKPLSARGALQKSDALVTLADIPATACALLEACSWDLGEDVRKAPHNDRERYFVFYEWQAAYWYAKDVPVERYKLTGPASQPSSWERLHQTPDHLSDGLAFNKSDPPIAYGFGWSDYESNGAQDWRWAVGKQADVYLRAPEQIGAHMKVSMATHAGNKGQVISLSANGSPLGSFPIEPGTPSTLSIRLPATIEKNTSVRLLFQFSKASSPSSHDSRPLAVMFDSLAFDRTSE